MLPPVAMFLLLVSGDASTVDHHTIEYEDTKTGEVLLCTLCPPGTYVSSPCTRTHDTVCLPCPKEHFTEVWNFLPKCLFCSTVCEGTQEVKQQCSATNNRVCRCKEGHYLQDHFCVPHTQCPPGTVVQTIGDSKRNTQCQKCPQGTFSAKASSAGPCIKHTNCGYLQVLFPGRAWHDNICSSCKDLTNGGGERALKDILQRYLLHHNIKPIKRHFITRFLTDRFTGQEMFPPNSNTKWPAKFQLMALPGVLKRMGLHNMARKIQYMLTRLKKKVSRCQRRKGALVHSWI